MPPGAAIALARLGVTLEVLKGFPVEWAVGRLAKKGVTLGALQWQQLAAAVAQAPAVAQELEAGESGGSKPSSKSSSKRSSRGEQDGSKSSSKSSQRSSRRSPASQAGSSIGRLSVRNRERG